MTRKGVGGLVLALFSWLLGARDCFANDSAFRGAPTDLVPLAGTLVEMVSEDILLTATNAEWTVEAKYVFKNPTKQEVVLQVGFPELRCYADPESDPCAGADRGFRNLKTTIDGTEVPARKGKLSAKEPWAEYLSVVWLYDVRFPPEKTLSIGHRYTLKTGENSMGGRFTEYVTRTGKTWAGPIQRARFEFRLPPYVHRVEVPAKSGLDVVAPRTISGPGARVEVVLEGKNWEPEGDLRIEFNGTARSAGELAVKSLIGRGETWAGWQDATPEGKRAAINLVYAAKGYPFASPALRAEYYDEKAEFRLQEQQGSTRSYARTLRSFAAFTVDWFDREDRELLRTLEKTRGELDLPAAPSSSAPTTEPALVPTTTPPRPSAASPAPSASTPRSAPSGNAPPSPAASQRSCACRAGLRTPDGGVSVLSLLTLFGCVLWRRGRGLRSRG